MSVQWIGALGVVALFVLLFFRVPVWAALVIVGLVGNASINGWSVAFTTLGTTPFDVANSYALSVVPLFILMGDVASSTKLSADLFNASRVLLSGLRGGLAVAAIGASACFGAVCGSSIATAATMTRIALPEMRTAKYNDGFAAGAIAAGGSLGILIPPSIILVIYAAIAEQSVPKLFAAALIPGLVLTALYTVVALVTAYLKPDFAPESPRVPWRERLEAMRKPWQFILLFVVTIGGIYGGIFSPTEAAAIGAAGAILLGVVGRRIGWTQLVSATEGAVITSALLFAIVIGATYFANFVVQTQLPNMLATGAKSLHLPGLAVMLLIIIAYVVIGCFLEGIGMVLITVPVFLPLVVQYGYDPVWFSIIVVIVVELGLIHPPVGMNLFVIQAQAPDIRLGSIYRGILPFLVAPFVLLALLLLFPQLALWLPKVLYG
ncbi:TRAP transporter large permease [Bradyrhizobium archetypum]|uniref:TRAP transporter large permease protein n=1 Tax=Bradyrhizobium archetypum TaxID=2721160 RepID=A0A7Y4H289_9BRAD|nr:TRAP transporter large permease [Bradyrhizobium archetypum]NOJ45964.1 TRAP transporter large permease [Bradyrhizobium archetypum]